MLLYPASVVVVDQACMHCSTLPCWPQAAGTFDNFAADWWWADHWHGYVQDEERSQKKYARWDRHATKQPEADANLMEDANQTNVNQKEDANQSNVNKTQCWSCGAWCLQENLRHLPECKWRPWCPHRVCPRLGCLETAHNKWIDICEEFSDMEQGLNALTTAASSRGNDGSPAFGSAVAPSGCAGDP